MDYMKMTIEDVIAWCQANGKVDWLKAKAQEKREFKVYPKVKNEEGKMVVDKSQPYKIEFRPISFIQLKKDFVNEFMPEIAPKAQKKETMFDKIMAL